MKNFKKPLLLTCSFLAISYNAYAMDPPIKDQEGGKHRYCSMKVVHAQDLVETHPGTLQIMLDNQTKWVNGTILKYYFFDQPSDGPFVGVEADKTVVRAAFQKWMDLNIGVRFKEVTTRREAEIRIGFDPNDGAWSYVGTGIKGKGANNRTMNLGWTDPDTALHEIGHTLGLPHEHQNPLAGIQWNEQAVYAALAGSPNNWPRATTYSNILEKINPDTVQGSTWDPDSIMHYPFGPGLILEPVKYYQNGLQPKGGISVRDKEWIKKFYPPLIPETEEVLTSSKKIAFNLKSGETRTYKVMPETSGKYQIETYGNSDTIIVLFDGSKQIGLDDDSGLGLNAKITTRLLAGGQYTLGTRL